MTFAKLANLGAALAMGAASLTLAAPAQAQPGYYRDGYRSADRYRDNNYRDYRRGDYYRGNGYYAGNRGDYRGNNYNYRYRCRNDGAAGTIIGAIAGGLLGHEVVGRRGDKTAGTIVGGAVGAVAGRAIDKGDGRC
jgi:hypothetical protein